MVKGQFDRRGQPLLPVELAGLHRTLTLHALVDTGFDGDLCVPITVAMTLGLELKDADYVELADGSVRRELIFHCVDRVRATPHRVGDVRGAQAGN